MINIAIIGTRGIPNYHGGFEQFAEYLSVGLVQKGHQVLVYNSHKHPFQESTYKGANIVHCFDPEYKIGTAGQFIYDLNCIRDLKKHNFDIVLQLGYTSSSVWGKLLPKKPLIITNMDGLEWKRSKYSGKVQWFLKNAERWAINTSHYWIADSIGIQNHLKESYQVESEYIPYGANTFEDIDASCLEKYNLTSYNYNMLVARLEPENNFEMILDGIVKLKTETPFIVIGKHQTKYGEFLKDKYKTASNIRFIGGVYDQHELSNIRYHTNLYFHGHSVGGTNPSLLEAMACNTFICAHNNIFNKSILGEDALYFQSSDEVADMLKQGIPKNKKTAKENNLLKIKELYSWETIIDQYEKLFVRLLKENQ
jgi:glycosyltransferase involved in cell wall biosynthesis